MKKMIVIMGGGLNNDCTLPDYVKARCDYAKKILSKRGDILIASSSYSMNIKPKVDRFGFIISEASAIYEYLKPKIKYVRIGCEQLSHDTIGSIYFCLELYANKMDYKNVIFVTSDFHAERVEIVSKFINRIIYKSKFSINIASVMTSMDKSKRIEKEKKSIQKFIKKYGNIETEKDFLRVLFFEHTNYNHWFGSKVKSSCQLFY